MDRNTIIGLVLIVGVLIGYSILTAPSKEEIARKKHQQDSIAQVTQKVIAAQQPVDSSKKEDVQVKETYLSDSAKLKNLENALGVFAKAGSDTNRFITVENDLFKIKFSTKGGRPYSVELKKYNRYDSTAVLLFDGDSTNFGLTFFAQDRNISTNDLFFTPQFSKNHIVITKDDSVSFRLHATDSSYIEYVYSFRPDNYMVGFTIHFVKMNKIISDRVIRPVELNWSMDVPRQEKGVQNENSYTNLHYMIYQGEDESFSATKDEETQEVETQLKWVAFKQQFFSSVLIAGNSFEKNASLQSVKFDDSQTKLKNYSAILGLHYQSAESFTVPLSFYFGPNHYKTLKKYDAGLENLVFIGRNIVKGINKFVILPIFNWLGKFISSYGLIIFLLTLIIKIGLFPLTFKSYQSQAKMRVLKPQIDEINKKIPKEKAMERQQATMALYKKVGVNPLGGCLPMLLQFPILIAMFRLFPTSIELRHQGFLWADDLSTYDSILQLPFNIPMYGDHVSLFTILMTITTIISMKMSQTTATDYSAMPGMKTMMYIMPVMFMFFLNSFSAGLTYYYFLANVITIAQNEIFKRMIDEEKLLKQLQSYKAKPAKKSKFQERLEKMAKERGYKAPKR
jgi:YidC/Oxa1 family membrane protein insertase